PRMPDLLTLDTKALLDHSEVGRAAAALLEKRWNEEGAAARAELERERARLREALLERARRAVERIAKKKKAKWVMEKGAVLWGKSVEITGDVIAAVDEAGPL